MSDLFQTGRPGAEIPGQGAEAKECQHRGNHHDARDAPGIGAVAVGQQRDMAGAGSVAAWQPGSGLAARCDQG
jgi:hypothetical protein